jgi:hypothetical protein
MCFVDKPRSVGEGRGARASSPNETPDRSGRRDVSSSSTWSKCPCPEHLPDPKPWLSPQTGSLLFGSDRGAVTVRPSVPGCYASREAVGGGGSSLPSPSPRL